MLHFDTRNLNSTTSSKSLFAFKPRQVLLAEHNSRNKMNDVVSKEENSGKIISLTPELKGSLHHSILNYLHRYGFSKTLKRFQSEAEIQSDTWKASLLHLEDIFCKYNACNDDSNLNTSKKSVLGNDEAIIKDNVCATKETITKKKKKGTVESDSGRIEDRCNVANKKITESNKNCGQASEDIIVNELETRPKKKKTKHDLDSSGQAQESKSDEFKKSVDDIINGLEIDDSTMKTKEKKKKSIRQDKLESSATDENELVTEVTLKEKKKKKKKKKSSPDSAIEDNQENAVNTDAENETIQPDASRKEKRSSKKRKRSLSDENDDPSTEMIITEESKCRKTETSKEEKSKKGDGINQETSNDQLNGLANGKLEINGGEKSGTQKSRKKHLKDSAEPKTVNAFQRVKIDEVEFAHQKLQDNSYWAKDGADIGYGAKAQEVLGQVRGRDFRHEKTKKKRGSYRGGLIDQQSHSIKFNYSDEE